MCLSGGGGPSGPYRDSLSSSGGGLSSSVIIGSGDGPLVCRRAEPSWILSMLWERVTGRWQMLFLCIFILSVIWKRSLLHHREAACVVEKLRSPTQTGRSSSLFWRFSGRRNTSQSVMMEAVPGAAAVCRPTIHQGVRGGAATCQDDKSACRPNTVQQDELAFQLLTWTLTRRGRDDTQR